jgi:hypothetical protein
MSIVIPVRDDARRLSQCLQALKSDPGVAKVEIVVIDNGSSDGSANVGQQAGATVLTMPRASLSAIRNLGAACTTGPLLGFVDADQIPRSGWITAGFRIFEDEDDLVAAGAPSSPPDEATWVQRSYDRLRRHVPGRRPIDWLTSGNLIVRRCAFDAVGGFDTSLGTCEDVDLCNRLRLAGGRIVADEALGSKHQGDPQTLSALFRGELWRGRDNLRVTLRGPLTASAIPSLAIPVVNFLCLVGLISSLWLGPALAIASIGTFLVLAILRALRMAMAKKPSTVVVFLQSLLVAMTYEAARACALVFRVSHRTRRA